jgi:hypothetical protein
MFPTRINTLMWGDPQQCTTCCKLCALLLPYKNVYTMSHTMYTFVNHMYLIHVLLCFSFSHFPPFTTVLVLLLRKGYYSSLWLLFNLVYHVLRFVVTRACVGTARPRTHPPSPISAEGGTPLVCKCTFASPPALMQVGVWVKAVFT